MNNSITPSPRCEERGKPHQHFSPPPRCEEQGKTHQPISPSPRCEEQGLGDEELCPRHQNVHGTACAKHAAPIIAPFAFNKTVVEFIDTQHFESFIS